MTGDRLLSEGSAVPAGKVDAVWDFVAGFQPVKRSKALYRRMDLLAERDSLASLLEAARVSEDADAEKDVLGQIRSVTRQIEESKFIWTIQQVTDSKRKEILAECEAAGVSDEAEVLLHVLAASTVEPAGIEVSHLQALVDVVPTQVAGLVELMVEMMSKTTNPRLTSPF